ncbi:MAG TPA: OmpA family protein [Kofleriaceae bacterium]|nr:OmpA family protein [Kofleriaceae bacterium]
MRSLLVVLALAAPALAAPASIHVSYDAAHLDLDKHVLQFKPSRAITSASITALGEDGRPLGSGAASYAGETGWLTITWTQPADQRVMMLQLRVSASDGAATDVQLIPWSVEIAHEDVNFATNSAEIDASEQSKLDDSVASIQAVIAKAGKFMKLRLYVAGHTDTVGPSAKNRALSLARAIAIGMYFQRHGITVPILVAGFGEDVPKVKTADNVDERANRRADYVIGPASGPPPFGGAYQKAKVTWQGLRVQPLHQR